MDDREAQIRALLPLVRTIARRIRRLVAGADFDDLIGDGSIGLIRAVDHYDPTRGASLEHYARALIAGAMLNGLRRMDPVSERVRRALRDGETTRYRLAMERGTFPRLSELERHAPGYVCAVIKKKRALPLSLDAPLPDGCRVQYERCDDPSAIVVERDRTRVVLAALDRLTPRQRAVIHAHYFGDQSLREISKNLMISPQRTSQLHVTAVARLRKKIDASAC